MNNRSLHYSANRLAAVYVCLCALCVGALLWVGFLFTARALQREVDLVIATVWGIALAALLSAAIGWWYSRRVAAHVRIMAQTCESIISGDPMRRLPQAGSRDEFGQLAAAVNHMLDRIEQQTIAVRATFNSAAHDLRAPLHRMRVRLESALDRSRLDAASCAVLDDTVGDLERVQRTLATLLQIAQADSAAAPGSQEPVDLGELCRELGDLYDPEARQRGLELTVRSQGAANPRPVSVSGNRQLLAQLLANLLENAIKYVPAGGRIGLMAEGTAGSASLIVSDNGPGIPEEARYPVLQPFQRLERAGSPPGCGLGLSLVAAVVRMHRGKLALLDNGPGLVVRCDFPALPPAAPPS